MVSLLSLQCARLEPEAWPHQQSGMSSGARVRPQYKVRSAPRPHWRRSRRRLCGSTLWLCGADGVTMYPGAERGGAVAPRLATPESTMMSIVCDAVVLFALPALMCITSSTASRSGHASSRLTVVRDRSSLMSPLEPGVWVIDRIKSACRSSVSSIPSPAAPLLRTPFCLASASCDVRAVLLIPQRLLRTGCLASWNVPCKLCAPSSAIPRPLSSCSGSATNSQRVGLPKHSIGGCKHVALGSCISLAKCATAL